MLQRLDARIAVYKADSLIFIHHCHQICAAGRIAEGNRSKRSVAMSVAVEAPGPSTEDRSGASYDVLIIKIVTYLFSLSLYV
jgi:hypothetical protein